MSVTLNSDQHALVREMLVRVVRAGRWGMQYGGKRDLVEVGGYPQSLDPENFEALRQRDGIASRVVNMPAETTWRAVPEVSEPNKADGTEFTGQVTDLAKRLRLWNRFERADKMARVGRYAILLIGTPDGDDQNLKNEMRRLRGPKDVLFVQPYRERHAEVATWVEDPNNPRFGQPFTYRVNLAGEVSSFRAKRTLGKAEIHWSRVIHIAEGLLDDDVFGESPLQAIFNDFHDLQKIKTSTAEAFWQRVDGILQAIVDPEMQGVDEGFFRDLDKDLQKLYHDLKRTFYGQGVELSRLSESEPDPQSAADLYMTLIAAGAGIPKRMLFGSETGERSSTEDQKTYLGSIASRQAQYAEPVILRPFIDRLIEYGGLARPGKDGYEVVWPTLFEESEKDIAEANHARANTAKALTPVGGDPLMLVEIDEERNVWLVPRKEGEASPFESPEPSPEGPETDDDAGTVEDVTPRGAANFDPSQPRDDSGKWTSGGGNSAFEAVFGTSAGSATEAAGYNQEARTAARSDPEAAAFIAGYDAFSDDVQLRKMRSDLDAAMRGDAASPEAQALVDAIRGAPGGAPELHRGISLAEDAKAVAAGYKKGTTLGWGPSSFSTDRDVAEAFSRKEFLDRPTRVMFRLKSGSQALRVENLSWNWSEREWLSAGQFRVLSSKATKNVVTVELEHLGMSTGANNRWWRWAMNEKWERKDPFDPTGEFESFAALRSDEENEAMRKRRAEMEARIDAELAAESE